MIPTPLPLLERLDLLLFLESTVCYRVDGQLLEKTQIRIERGDAQKGEVEVMGQGCRTPERGIVGRDDNGYIVGYQRGCRMIAIVVAQLEYLIRHGAHLDGNVQRFGQIHCHRMLDQGIAMTNALGAQQYGIDKVLIDGGAIPIGLARMKVEVNVLGKFE